jgi:hypothetical protein
MTDSLPKKDFGDHIHLGVRTLLSAIPTLGGPALELFNAVIAPPLEQRRNRWLNDLADRIYALENEKRIKLEDLATNEQFISAIMNATTAAVRNHQREKIAALRNAVLNCALRRCPSEIKSSMFLALIDQFSVWHLLILRELHEFDSRVGQNYPPKTTFEEITIIVVEKNAELRSQQALVQLIVEELCRKGLLYWGGGLTVTYTPRGTTQVTSLGREFLTYVSDPQSPADKVL